MKNSTIYVFGHKNPDTDSICAAISYAELKQKLGYTKATARRLGEINKETEYILDYFGVEKPELIESVRSQVSDMDYYEVPEIYPDMPIGDVWDIMLETERRMFPVVDRETKDFIGVISMGDIARVNMQIEDCGLLGHYKPTVDNIVSVMDANVLAGEYNLHKGAVITGKVSVAMSPDDIAEANPQSNDVIITRASAKCTRAALQTKAKYILLIGDCEDDFTGDFSKLDGNRIVLCTTNDVYTTIRLLNHSIPVSSIMKTKDIIYFYDSDYFVEVKNTMIETRFRYFPILNQDNKVIGTISRRHIIDVDKKKIILVDHNEKAQSAHGLEEAEVLEIIDHHNVGDVQTGKPILFRNEPVGCSSTIVANMYFEHNIKPSKKIAGLMLGAILSDTLLFKSPTCTMLDKLTAEKLAAIAGVDIETFGMDALKAGASMKGKTMKEILNVDYKEYHINNRKIFVSQVFTTDLDEALKIKDEMIKYMAAVCEDRQCDLGTLMVTDILGSGTQLLFSGKARDIAEKAFNVEKGESIIFLPKVVSRKKEIIPQLSKYA